MSIQPPLIILGMHRSGTSLVAKLLEALGLYIGAEQLVQQSESTHFVWANNWILKQCSATWDTPSPFAPLPQPLQQPLAELLQQAVQLFWSQYAQNMNPDQPWGWKDPRTSLTHSLWQKVYPKATFIHVYRHPVDVAWSLHTREVKMAQSILNTAKSNSLSFIQSQKSLGISSIAFDLFRCFDLWKTYVQSCQQIPQHKVLHLQYENLLANPKSTLQDIASFSGISFQENRISTVIKQIDPSRQYAYRSNPKLVEFARRICSDDLVQKLQYHP